MSKSLSVYSKELANRKTDIILLYNVAFQKELGKFITILGDGTTTPPQSPREIDPGKKPPKNILSLF